MLQTKLVDNIETHFMFNMYFPKIMSFMRLCEKKSRVRTLMAIRRMRIACWIPKGTDTNSEYVRLLNSISDYAQWRTQEFCLVGEGVQQIQLRTEGSENGDLGR
jgi:hypothetical protein